MGNKLLVIDDEPGVANVIALVAGGLGFLVRVVNCPIGAIDAFIDFRPDLVILDMIMPEKDGIDVLNELLLTGLDCRIVLTSGLSEAYLRLAEGIARFHASEVAVLRKPFRRQDLVNVLVPTEQSKPWRASRWLALSA